MLMDQGKREMDEDVACMDIGPVPPGLLRCDFLAVGGYDKTVRILSLKPGEDLRTMATQVGSGGVLVCAWRQWRVRPGSVSASECSRGGDVWIQWG